MGNIYTDIRFWEQITKELEKQTGAKADKAKEYLDDLKRKARKSSQTVSDVVMVRSYGMDGYVLKFPLPESITSAEDADEYFREYEYLYYRPSAFDCTGQHFTSWYKIFRKPNGRFWAYHSVSVDV